MVIYDLVCDLNHQFEGWFRDASDVESQRESGLLQCPFCDSYDVVKKLTASKITKKSNSGNAPSQGLPASAKPQSIVAKDSQAPEKFAQLQKMLGQVHDYIDSNFEDVGNRFADEAISIHKGEKEAANIRGTASKEQLKELAEEGVEAVALPPKPVDKKKIN